MTTNPRKRPRPLLGLSICAALFIISATAPARAAQLYQWQDEDGVTHYTDKPPKGRNAQKLHVKAPATSGTAAAETVEPDDDARDANAQRCETERQRLQVLQSNMTVRMRNDDGTMRELTPEEMQEEIEFSQTAVARYCGSQNN